MQLVLLLAAKMTHNSNRSSTMAFSPQGKFMMITERNQCCFVGALILSVMTKIKRELRALLLN